jgi:hypothetical protein
VEIEPRPRAVRPGARRLKDISHLYLSTGRRAAPFELPRPERRVLRLVVAGPAEARVRAEFTANLALQFARLGRRTLVVDAEPQLPNAGFRLGLAPDAYLAHLAPEPPRVVHGLGGVQVLVGVAGRVERVAQDEALVALLRVADCVLAQAGDAAMLDRIAGWMGVVFPAAPAESTLERAAPTSPLVRAWMSTAQRPAAPPAAARSEPLDAVLWVEEASREGPAGGVASMHSPPVRRVAWGATPDLALRPGVWARLEPHPAPVAFPVVALEPDHPAARAYEGLAQSLLAGLARPGGARA